MSTVNKAIVLYFLRVSPFKYISKTARSRLFLSPSTKFKFIIKQFEHLDCPMSDSSQSPLSYIATPP